MRKNISQILSQHGRIIVASQWNKKWQRKNTFTTYFKTWYFETIRYM